MTGRKHALFWATAKVRFSCLRIVGAVRDTVLVPPMATVRLACDADNPGRWAFHCHNLYHMATGMMTEFRYDSVAFGLSGQGLDNGK